MRKFWKQSAPATTDRQRFDCPKNLPVDPLRLEGPYQLPRPELPIKKYNRRKPRKDRPKLQPKSLERALPKTEWISVRKELGKPNETEKPAETGSSDIATLSKHKIEINRMLGPGKWHSSAFKKLLEKSISQDATIQRVLPMVMAAATDITVEENERNEAVEALIDFTIEHRDHYNAVRMMCDDCGDKLTSALAEIVFFYDKLDELLSQRSCEVYSRVADIDMLEKELEKKKEEMRGLSKKQRNAVKTAAVGSLAAAPIIELITPGLVAQFLPFYMVYMGVLGLIGWHMKNKKSLRNLSEQRLLEAKKDEAVEEMERLALPKPAYNPGELVIA